MPKSLEEIQAEFKSKMSISKEEVPIKREEADITIAKETKDGAKEEIKEKTKEETTSSGHQTKGMALISDIIFAFALIMMGMCAIILSYGDAGSQADGIYHMINEKREIILAMFAILVIFSFFLRFFAQKQEA